MFVLKLWPCALHFREGRGLDAWTPGVVLLKRDGWRFIKLLSGLFALGAGDRFDGAERSVEPGLFGGLHLVESQTQMMLQVLFRKEGGEGTQKKQFI